VDAGQAIVAHVRNRVVHATDEGEQGPDIVSLVAKSNFFRFWTEGAVSLDFPSLRAQFCGVRVRSCI